MCFGDIFAVANIDDAAIDAIAVDFCYINTRRARQRLVEFIYDTPRERVRLLSLLVFCFSDLIQRICQLDALPFLARLLASLVGSSTICCCC